MFDLERSPNLTSSLDASEPSLNWEKIKAIFEAYLEYIRLEELTNAKVYELRYDSQPQVWEKNIGWHEDKLVIPLSSL